MTNEIELNVTQDDINRARPGGENCPISQAAMRLFPDCNVYTTYLSLNILKDGDVTQRYILPHEARNFIGTYDDHKSVQPISFRAALRP